MTEKETKNRDEEVRLVPLFHTVLATQNKTSELFVKSFQYQGENIATKHLGQIFGFFEIPDTQEDNAYIVNFLASVVKKEYFVNPKRSVGDSFEAALHKINLALTELVKQGNTGWLGKLHGAVCVIEGNNFHFSVTGDAAILLYRENQVTCISEGLADKDAALHPLKTFLEISSGILLPEDKLLLSSPELFTLCEPEVLRKNAFRMDKNGFARFVKAALVNELPLGVSLIIDIGEEKILPAPKRKAKELREESLEKLQNVFSGTSFKHDGASVLNEEAPASSLLEEEPESPAEYTDQKTGHIYVQGETNQISFQEPSGWQTFLEEYLRPLWKSFLISWRRLTKKSRKVVKKQAGVIGVEAKEFSTTFWNASKETGKKFAQKGSAALQKSLRPTKSEVSEEPIYSPSLPEVEHDFREPSQEESFDIPVLVEEENALLSPRQKALHKFSQSYQPPERNRGLFGAASSSISVTKIARDFFNTTLSFFSGLFGRFKNASIKQKIFLGAGILVVIMGSVFFFSGKEQSQEVREESSETNPETASLQTPPAHPTLGEARSVTTWAEGQALLVVKTDTTTVVVTPKTVVIDGNAIPFPADGTVLTATYMTDLRMIFMWSDKRELASWSVVDRKFSANTFPLPANTTVSKLGSYLTYLYALDNNQGTIYRFARTEGGFTEGTSWLKTPIAKESAQALVVTDTIRIAGPTLDQYLRGSKEKTVSETSYDILGLSSERNFTLGIETESGKISVWNTEGATVYDGTFEELKGVSAVTYSESDKKLLVTKDQNLLEYNLSW